jgi:hypothetical protein
MKFLRIPSRAFGQVLLGGTSKYKRRREDEETWRFFWWVVAANAIVSRPLYSEHTFRFPYSYSIYRVMQKRKAFSIKEIERIKLEGDKCK